MTNLRGELETVLSSLGGAVTALEKLNRKCPPESYNFHFWVPVQDSLHLLKHAQRDLKDANFAIPSNTAPPAGD